MEYPSAYELLIYSLGAGTLLTYILPRLKRIVKKEVITYKGIGSVKVKEKRVEFSAEWGARFLICVWILSVIYTWIGPMMSIPLNVHNYINAFLWMVTSVGSLLSGHAFFRWIKYSLLFPE